MPRTIASAEERGRVTAGAVIRRHAGRSRADWHHYLAGLDARIAGARLSDRGVWQAELRALRAELVTQLGAAGWALRVPSDVPSAD
jgi:hypothetical protein